MRVGTVPQRNTGKTNDGRSKSAEKQLRTTCSRRFDCFLEFCHQGCTNPLLPKCKPNSNTFDFSTLSYSGVCVECMAHNQCVDSAKPRCDFETYKCVARPADTGFGAYMFKNDADEWIMKPNDRIQDTIGAVQTSGASVAEIFANTR